MRNDVGMFLNSHERLLTSTVKTKASRLKRMSLDMSAQPMAISMRVVLNNDILLALTARMPLDIPEIGVRRPDLVIPIDDPLVLTN